MTIVKRIYEHEYIDMEVTRTEVDSISIGLKCGDHNHEDLVIGPGPSGWCVSKKTSENYLVRGMEEVLDAVESGTDYLANECGNLLMIDEIDGLFYSSKLQEDEDAPTLKERLEALAAFLPEFESPGFKFERMMSYGAYYYCPSSSASRFIQACSNLEWVGRFDWFDWKDSPEANRFWENPSALSDATSEQLGKLLAVLIRLDFVDRNRDAEASMIAALDSGLLVAILRRAVALAEELEPEEGDNLGT